MGRVWNSALLMPIDGPFNEYHYIRCLAESDDGDYIVSIEDYDGNHGFFRSCNTGKTVWVWCRLIKFKNIGADSNSGRIENEIDDNVDMRIIKSCSYATLLLRMPGPPLDNDDDYRTNTQMW